MVADLFEVLDIMNSLSVTNITTSEQKMFLVIVTATFAFSTIITFRKRGLSPNKNLPNDPTPDNVDRREFQTQGTPWSWTKTDVSENSYKNLRYLCVGRWHLPQSSISDSASFST